MKIVVSGCVRHRGRWVRRTDYVRKTYSIQGSFGGKKQSIETLKVRKTTLEYLRQNGFKTVEDIIDKQLEIPSEYRGNIYAYLMFGIEN